jgi:RHS repeat-associated protein
MEELVNGAVARSYTYGLDRISENQLVSGAWTASFYGVDGGGSVRQLANSSGTPTDTYEYDAFGNLVDKTGPSQNTYTPNNYLYRGEQYDPDLGLYYLRARYYNPVTGRFLSADPLASEGQRRYQYAGADPVNGVDPTGMDLIELAMLAQYANRVQIPSMDIHSWCGTTVDGQIVGVLPLCGIIIPDFPLFALIPPPQHTVKVCWRSLMKWKKNESQPNAIMGHYKHTYIEIDTIFPGAKPIRETWGVLGYPRPKGKDQEVMHNDPDNSPFGGSGCRPVDCPDSVALDFEATLKATEWTPGSTFHCPSCGKNYRRLSFNSNTYTFNMVTYWTHTVPPPLDDVNAPGYNWDDRYAGYPW